MDNYIETNNLYGQSIEFEISKNYRQQIGFSETSNLPNELNLSTKGTYYISCTYGKIYLSLHVEKGEKNNYRIFYKIDKIIRNRK